MDSRKYEMWLRSKSACHSGKVYSESTKKKISDTLKRRCKNGEIIPWLKGTKGIMKPNSGSFKKGMKPWNTGKIMTEEHRKNMSNYLKGMKMPKRTKEHTEKLRLCHLGKKRSIESKRKMSIAKIGKPSNRQGKKLTIEQRKRLSIAHIGIQAKEKHPNWLGGKSFEPYGLEWTNQLRQSIRERDNHVCQLCNKHQSQLKRILCIHHIDYVKTNNFTFNLVSLCITCHVKTNYNRDYWKLFFRNFLQDKYGYKYHIFSEVNCENKQIKESKIDIFED